MPYTIIVAPHVPSGVVRVMNTLAGLGAVFSGRDVVVVSGIHGAYYTSPVVAAWMAGSIPYSSALEARLVAAGFSRATRPPRPPEHGLEAGVEMAFRLGASRVLPVLLPGWDHSAAERLAEAAMGVDMLVSTDMSHCIGCQEASRLDKHIIGYIVEGRPRELADYAVAAGFRGDCTACLTAAAHAVARSRCRTLAGPLHGCGGYSGCTISWALLVLECRR